MATEPFALTGGSSHTFGRYQILSHLGTGGMGTVYKAQDSVLGREVALKILSQDCAAHPALLERFRREARHSARLKHENIVTLYEFGEWQGMQYLALEFVTGINLQDYISEKGQLEPEEARQILIQAARALEQAHRQGIVHRDIKPANLLLTHKDGHLLVKLTDFGVAREVNDEQFRVTSAGLTLGTVDYMAPEQARDSSLADIRSDIYALGCTLYHMLAGQPPFPQGSLTERLLKHIEAEPPEILQLNSRVPPHQVAVLKRMMAKAATERFQTPTELLQELTRPGSGLPRANRKPRDPSRKQASRTKRANAVTTQLPAAGAEKRKPQPAVDPEYDSSPLVLVSDEQRKVADAQYQRAKEVLAAGDQGYAQQLLLSCCKLDPGHLLYRRTLRRLERMMTQNARRGSPLGWLTGLPSRSRLQAARRAGDHRKVLELGEEVLTRNWSDVPTQIAMAEAATKLGLARVALWLREQAQKIDPTNITLLRELARSYEQIESFERAIELWEAVRKAAPNDFEAQRKTTELAASETIARGQYEKNTGGEEDS